MQASFSQTPGPTCCSSRLTLARIRPAKEVLPFYRVAVEGGVLTKLKVIAGLTHGGAGLWIELLAYAWL